MLRLILDVPSKPSSLPVIERSKDEGFDGTSRISRSIGVEITRKTIAAGFRKSFEILNIQSLANRCNLTAIDTAISDEDKALLLLLTSLPSSYDNSVQTLLYRRDTLKARRRAQSEEHLKKDCPRYNHKKSQGFVRIEDQDLSLELMEYSVDGMRIHGTGKVQIQMRDGQVPVGQRQSGKIKVIKGSLVVLSGTRRANCVYTLDGQAVTRKTLKGRKQLGEYLGGRSRREYGFSMKVGKYKKTFIGFGVVLVKVISSLKAGLKDDMDARIRCYVLTKDARSGSDDSDFQLLVSYTSKESTWVMEIRQGSKVILSRGVTVQFTTGSCTDFVGGDTLYCCLDGVYQGAVMWKRMEWRKLRSYDAAHDGLSPTEAGYMNLTGVQGGYLAKGTRNIVRIRAKDSSGYCYRCLVKGYPWSKVSS
ncbi:hypothetical protein Tco_0578885 [Tanacetum coccineum]|uniref:Uncharacterized protein n=1 Tax=Tanacetum coccineum TaxID=301880 RepID=A0ABQ5AZF7_9ASTR